MKNYKEVREALREIEHLLPQDIITNTGEIKTSYYFTLSEEGNLWSIIRGWLNDNNIAFTGAGSSLDMTVMIFCEGSSKQDGLKQIGQLLNNVSKQQRERMEANEDSQKG